MPDDSLGCNEEIPDDADREDDDDDDEEEDEAECSAPHCKKPIADQISWVQCDHCQEWFHCTCVDLTKEYAEKIDKYNCKKCAVLGVRSGHVGVASRGGDKARTVQQQSKGQLSSSSGTTTTTTSSGAASVVAPQVIPVSSQNLMKDLLQNPQLAAQLLRNLPLK